MTQVYKPVARDVKTLSPAESIRSRMEAVLYDRSQTRDFPFRRRPSALVTGAELGEGNAAPGGFIAHCPPKSLQVFIGHRVL